ncbi:MAG TPA: GH25 family lysozyme [Actinomycetota bacterium]|nr:GH25 family lysozyme [Actinomycetota bacterium]
MRRRRTHARRGRLIALLGAFAAAVALVPSTTGLVQAAPAGTTPGIDISQYQETIDWAAVNHNNVQFVIMRATKGESEVDTAYTTNLAGATANGFVIGAYHRATPSLTPEDAEVEADHFLAVARNAAGDVLPALDIEETGGLTVAQLKEWVRAWLARVRNQLGVRPMIYASPYFWRTNLGNTKWFANHRYPLWIAHWYVPAPDVPANNWSGRGWTFWQWTSTGSLTGIPTDVDRDRFNGTDLSMGRMASLTITPPAGGTVTGSRISCGDDATECSRLANPGDELTLTAVPDPGAELMGWTGECASAGTSPTCTVTALGDVSASAVFGYPVEVSLLGTGAGVVSSSPAGVECGTTCRGVFEAGSMVTLTATADSASTFGTWSGACAGSSPSCQVTLTGVMEVGAQFDATTQLGETGAGTGYEWGSKSDPGAIGGSYRWERRADASTTFEFEGSAVTLVTVAGPAMGKASVSIDGGQVATINGYAQSSMFGIEDRYTQLGPGTHMLTVTALGTRGPQATGTRVAVDALRWGGTLRKNPKASASTWSSVVNASAGGGAYVVSDVAGASASLSFTGTGATLITVRGPGTGRAEIWVDGTLIRTVDLYAASNEFGVQRTVSGFVDGPHVVTVIVLGTHRAIASGSAVAVDGWIIK